MAQDNSPPADEGRVPQARRLAEQALAAERAGDADAAERPARVSHAITLPVRKGVILSPNTFVRGDI